jgi:uncharacterized RDD family membrane protein YckC
MRPAVAAPPVVVATPTTLASFGRRFVATVIDNVLVAFLVVVALPLFVHDFQNRTTIGLKAFYAAVLAGNQDAFTPDFDHLMTIILYTGMALTLAYGAVCLGLWSRTLGQRMLSIAVSPLDKPADKVGWSRGVSRSLAWTLLSQGGSFFPLVNVFSISMILWHPKRQSLPDLLARTQVVCRD